MKNPKIPDVQWRFPGLLTLQSFVYIFLFLVGVIVFFLVDFEETILGNKLKTPLLIRSLYFVLYILLSYALVLVMNSFCERDLQYGGNNKFYRSFSLFNSKPNIKIKENLGWAFGALFFFFLPFLFREKVLKANGDIFSYLNPKVFIVIPLLRIGYYIIQYYIADYYLKARKFLKYFYPSILSTIVLSFILVQQEQFSSFFIDFMDAPFNLFLFSAFLFFISISTVWFAPSYLFFTDYIVSYGNYSTRDIKEDIFRNVLIKVAFNIVQFFPYLFHCVFFPSRNKSDSKKYLYKLLWKHKSYVDANIKYSSESSGFAFFRLLIGISYIATLATIVGEVALKACKFDLVPYKVIITVITFLLPLIFIFWHEVWLNKLRNSDYQEQDRMMLNQSRAWRYNVGCFFIGVAFLIGISIVNKYVYTNLTLQMLGLFTFVVVSVISAVVLTNIGFLYPKTKNLLSKKNGLTIEKNLKFNRLKKYNRWFTSVILATNMSVAIFAVVVFLVLLIFPFRNTFPLLEKVNTVNIYLLLVNGLIAAFTLFDRFLIIKRKVEQQGAEIENEPGTAESQQKDQKIEKKPSISFSHTARTWAFVIIVFAVAYYFNKQGNDYHQIQYNKVDEYEDGMELWAYTEKFLGAIGNKGNEPIFFIGADGGGLKAAYWTMLVLSELDELGLSENVFLMSGASGGAIGEGIFTYLKSLGLSNKDIRIVVDKLGDTNFVSGDLAGLFTRWPMRYIPGISDQIENRQDRMEAMSEFYFHRIKKEIDKLDLENKFTYSYLRKQPYHHIWSEAESHLPIVITNTVRAEDGVKGWIHPLSVKDAFFQTGIVNVTCRFEKDSFGNEQNEFISFPDALFLTNRFPIMSPAARIRSKGHFIDAGALDNSGIETIVQVLLKMKVKGEEKTDSSANIFTEFLKHPLHIISIRHDRSRLINSMFTDTLEGYLGQTNPRSELSAFLGAIVSSGITGNPKVLDQILNNGEIKKLLNIKGFTEINLPFRLTKKDVTNYFKRSIVLEARESKIDSMIIEFNESIYAAYEKYTNADISRNRRIIVEPPLGRLISNPAQKFMKAMLHHPMNRKAIDSLLVAMPSLPEKKK